MIKLRFLTLLLMVNCSLIADPWGKDADLVHPSPQVTTTRSETIQEVLIKFHQDVISPADGPRSHFYPSSSQYTLEAMQRYGFITGFWMGCDRLQRENDEEWVYKKALDGSGSLIKFDPVR